MNLYIETVIAYPILTAMLQFAVLGTLGDMISKWIVEKKIFLPFTIKVLALKMAEWAFLAVCIKYAFTGYGYFVSGLVAKGMLPELNQFWNAFAISASMNLQFGVFLVIMHRLLDNLIAREQNWKNIEKGIYSLLWFWLPAHTVTFLLPKPFQIGLAALWSVALGLILGLYAQSKKS